MQPPSPEQTEDDLVTSDTDPTPPYTLVPKINPAMSETPPASNTERTAPHRLAPPRLHTPQQPHEHELPTSRTASGLRPVNNLQPNLQYGLERDATHVMPPPTNVVINTPRTTLGGVLKICLNLLLAAGVMFVLGVVAMAWYQHRNSDSVYSNLRAFAVSEIINNDLKEVEDLTVDDLSLYAQATCVQGGTADDVRNALEIQLSKLPGPVREEVIRGAIIDGMSSTNSVQNSTAGASNDGTAYSYLAFWSTAYNGDHTIMAPTYSTCIMAAGITMSIGEDVAGFETNHVSRQIGSKPCECGYFVCGGTCPIFEKVEVRKPIFKRHKLTLKNQIDLHRWMVKQAVDRASSLMSEHRRLPIADMQVRRDSLSSLSWQGPSTNTFLGSDRADGNEDFDLTTKEEL